MAILGTQNLVVRKIKSTSKVEQVFKLMFLHGGSICSLLTVLEGNTAVAALSQGGQ